MREWSGCGLNPPNMLVLSSQPMGRPDGPNNRLVVIFLHFKIERKNGQGKATVHGRHRYNEA